MCMLWPALFNHLPLSSKNKSDTFWHIYAYEITLVADFKKGPVKKMSRMQWIVKEFLWCFYFRNQKNYGIMWRKKNHLLLCACAAFLDNKCFKGTNRLVFLQISSSSAVKKASHFKMGTKVMQACCVYFLADPVHLC